MRYLVIAGCALLAACGSKTNNQTTTGNGSAATASVQPGTSSAFASSFRTRFVDSCVSGAKNAAARAGNAAAGNMDYTPLCTCSADKLLATKSEAELMQGPSPADALAVAQACAREHPPV